MASIQTIKMKQGVDLTASFTVTDDGDPVTLNPNSDNAYMELFQLKRVNGSLTQLSYKESKDLTTLTKAAGEISLTSSTITFHISRKKSSRWDLEAVNDPIVRSVNSATTPPTTTLTYPVQLVHGRLYVNQGGGQSYTWSGIPFEFEVEVTEND